MFKNKEKRGMEGGRADRERRRRGFRGGGEGEAGWLGGCLAGWRRGWLASVERGAERG